MISAWWLLAAFVGGAYAGILLIGLMTVASEALRRDERAAARSCDRS